MKKILIVSFGDNTGLSIKNQLKHILKDRFYIDYIRLCDIENHKLDCDLLIFSSEEVKQGFPTDLNLQCDFILSKRIINHEYIDEILNIPEGSEVLLVNDSYETCNDVINQLKNCGIDHINYNYYYIGINSYKETDIAITPGESHLVPNGIKKVIDIKSRKLDITSIIEILIKLNVLEEYSTLISSYFYRDIIKMSKKYIDISQESTRLKDLLSNILDNQKNGIIYTNIDDKVLVLNNQTLEFLNLSKKDIISKNLYEVCDCLKNDIITINDKEILVSKEKIKNNNIHTGNMIILNETENIHKIDDELRKKEKSKNNKSKYTFDDIVGNCNFINRTIHLAKKIAKTNSTVLIQGETGTGKEVLAQAIHNESNRKDYPFVAVNFAAMSESLIESELFGYEEGAFTGAKKGGKEGLFKKAHKGTIFLDEIGDASLLLQSRLLRVLQEREITPVGSTETIPVDIRVISATNKDLAKEVELKNFRKDLYYRLNVMPVYSIPLRERKEDIIPLLKYHLYKLTKDDNLLNFFEKDALDLLESYDWPGNIRELVNLVEYAIAIKDPFSKINSSDLPRYILDSMDISEINYSLISDKNKSKNIYNEDYLNKNELWVLNKIDKYEGIGRRTLSMMSDNEGFYISEAKVRNILNKLKKEGYIEVKRGLKSTKLLEKGLNILSK